MNRPPFKLSVLALFATQLFPTAAFSQQITKTEPSALEAVVIESQRSTSALARMAQEEAPNLINLITAEEMRKFPDVNIAESVRRLPGISLETDTGEGRFINIRGIDADLNSTTFGGLRLPPSNNASPFSGGRAVALDAIPTGLVGAITVTKSNLPEQDAEALGGTIEITPKTAPRNGQLFFEARIGTGYEPLRKTTLGEISITTGGRFGSGDLKDGAVEAYADRPLSVVLTATQYNDKRGIDDVEPGFLDDGVNPDLAYAGWDQRYYQYERKRHGLGIDIGYQANRDNAYYFRAFDAGYTESVLRNRLTITPDGTPTFSGATGFFTDGLTANGFDKTLRDEKEEINNQVYVLGGKNLIDQMQLDYRVGLTRGSYEKLYDYNSKFNYTPATGTIQYNNLGNGNTPAFSVSSDVDYLNPANYTLAKFTNATQRIKDQERSIAINLKTPVSWSGFEEEDFKLGLSGRWRDRSATGQPYSYKNLPALLLTSAASGGNVNFYDGQYNNAPAMAPDLLQALYTGNRYISSSNVTNALLQTTSQRENVTAIYGQYQLQQGSLQVIGGIRAESTAATYDANALGVDALGNSFVAPISQSNSYSNFFPSLQTKYALNKSSFVRAAFSSTIARPGFNQVTGALVIDPAANSVTQGNPNLRPVTANSFDVAYEYYLKDAGIFSIGFFDKEIKDYIAANVSTQSFPNNGLFAGFVGAAHVYSFTNLGSSYARGLELNYEQRFKDLPGAMSGLGLSGNYAYVDSKFEIRPGELSLLPSTSKNTLNVAVFYEKDGLNLRLSTYSISRNLFGIGGSGATDVYSEARTSVDLSGTYAFTKNYSVYFGVKNLTNTPLVFAEGSSNRVIQREFYGATYQIGANISF